eukprot:CAMPEP_0202390666 /NCGR_PEP_ID=MMETSP1127-20130417/89925_1 /ASSEMBLY_ACC=CAM_ASM_000462 /TAXON_ID=3047 /ORGANISM="Dunaliella tertiolecta, Strain CCMP1320" /LENGTH=86 /DNA_ID=CAMNT_0048992961 /DNA_START=187 /DNA_END=444 /DNA_ORIENTATION=+
MSQGSSNPAANKQWQCVEKLNLQLARPKFASNVIVLCPLFLSKHEALSPNALKSLFPALSALNLAGQSLPSGFLAALPSCLTSLQL